ncbi:glycogen debranching protein GlgX [Microbacterium sp. AZCO]|uniref:glycogen debranching protein GlgX n=1 Tax=Microbacterium sp. AZCO TaxID=3142976 RepID=UPI0031F3F821
MQVTVRPGRPYPLGARATSDGVNFALAAPRATAVDLCLFDPDGTESRIALPARDAGIWHGLVTGVGPGQRYGYRVHGDWDPAEGRRFNPAKLLLDPYARAIGGAVTFTPAAYGHDAANPTRPDGEDSAGVMPRSIVVEELPPAGEVIADAPERRSLADAVLYEVHVKGFTATHPDIPENLRGTYAGLAHPAAIAHLTSLGVTAVELLPVHQSVPEAFLVEAGLTNYWGYNTIGYFAPHAGYSAAVRAGRPGGQVAEFRAMVDALHAAGLSVILDVVYNHTAEAGADGPTIAFRGIANKTYYRLSPSDPATYVDTTGCGNSLNVGEPFTLRLMMDSLRYWVTEMGVDGFRFDLAPSLARADGSFSALSAFFDLVAQDPVLAQVILIAEPWDVGQGDSYDLGRFPAGWSEWNGRFRDTVRDFWRSHDGLLPDLAARITGSPDLYTRHSRGPDASINLVTVHDGFTLADLVSYDGKHNEANGQDNRDGTDDNRSWNCGVEGPTDDATVVALRARQRRAMLSTLVLSRGVPLLLGGDDIGRTQRGNNNAYCLDDEVTWWDWAGADADLHAFTANLVRLRHRHPVLRRTRYPSHPEAVRWFTPSGAPMSAGDWSDGAAKSVALVLSGALDPDLDDASEALVDVDVAMLLNAWWEPLDFALPWADAVTVESDSFEPARAGTIATESITVGPRSFVLVARA